jgi:uncharacterized protein
MKNQLPQRSKVIEPVLKQLSNVIREHYKERLKLILLYGSYARGNFSDESDLDVMLVLDQVDSVLSELDTLTRIKHDLMLEHEKFISTNPVAEIRFLHSKDPYFSNVKKEGVLL